MSKNQIQLVRADLNWAEDDDRRHPNVKKAACVSLSNRHVTSAPRYKNAALSKGSSLPYIGRFAIHSFMDNTGRKNKRAQTFANMVKNKDNKGCAMILKQQEKEMPQKLQRSKLEPYCKKSEDYTSMDTQQSEMFADNRKLTRLPPSIRSLLIQDGENYNLVEKGVTDANEKGDGSENATVDASVEKKEQHRNKQARRGRKTELEVTESAADEGDKKNINKTVAVSVEDLKLHDTNQHCRRGGDSNMWNPDEKLVVTLDNRILEQRMNRFPGDGEETSPKVRLLLDQVKTEAEPGTNGEKVDYSEKDRNEKDDLNKNTASCDNVKESPDIHGERIATEMSWVGSDGLISVDTDAHASPHSLWTMDAGYEQVYMSAEEATLFRSLGGTFPQRYMSLSDYMPEEVENKHYKGAKFECRMEKGEFEYELTKNSKEKDQVEEKEFDDSITMETSDDIETDTEADFETSMSDTLSEDDISMNAVENYDKLESMTVEYHMTYVAMTKKGQSISTGDELDSSLEDLKADLQSCSETAPIEMNEGRCHGDKVISSAEIGIMKLKALLMEMQNFLSESKSGSEKLSAWLVEPLRPRIPTPVLPQTPGDLPASCGRNGRGLPWLWHHEKAGRRCSGGSGARGSSGHDFSKQGSGGYRGRGRGNSSDDTNNNNNNSRRQGDRRSDGYDNGRKNDTNNNDNSGNSNNNSREPSRSPEMVSHPAPNFKRFRKKHCTMSVEDWSMLLGELAMNTDGPVWLMKNKSPLVCVSICLDKPDELTDDMIACCVCLSINSLLSHFANCHSPYNMCKMCVKIFSLICIHVHHCTSNAMSCEVLLCQEISLQLGSRHISQHIQRLWYKARKHLARVIGGNDETLPYPTQPSHERHSVTSIPSSFAPSLQSIPELTPIPDTGSRKGSQVLARKLSNLANVPEQEEEGSNLATEVTVNVPEPMSPETTVYTRIKPRNDKNEPKKELTVTDDALLVVSPESRPRSPAPGSASLPPGSQRPFVPQTQFPSFHDRPTGIKGIGEVVYSEKQQLTLVAKYWAQLKLQYQVEEELPIHRREEGVILEELKDKLLINKTRYGIDYQWVKVSHLGNGMFGKCHLATDFDTDFKFCVKEIPIPKYEAEEIELWSELDHPNIVQIYGAIRHGENIYVFSEFIDGGCLTEAINSQRTLHRRLSHRTALRYFQQLLEVLVYLKSKHILNEDIKADNVLLCRDGGDSVSVKLTDFGLARRCDTQVRRHTKPVGTQTQWSPEKAECVEYGFSAELWAGVCVLVHMLSGYPPWIRRFSNSVKSLIVVIVEQSPPLQDVPRNITEPVRDLIERGFTVCPGQRPAAEDLLKHKAFKLLDKKDEGLRDEAYSLLPPSIGPGPDNQLPDEENEDLVRILHSLSQPGKEKKSRPSFVPPETDAVYPVGATEPGQTAEQLHPSRNISVDLQNYIDDDLQGISSPGPDLEEYDPEMHKNCNNSGTDTENIDPVTLAGLIPDFSVLLPSERSLEEIGDEDDDPLKSFDLEKAIEGLELNVPQTLPTVLHSSDSLTAPTCPSSKSEGSSQETSDLVTVVTAVRPMNTASSSGPTNNSGAAMSEAEVGATSAETSLVHESVTDTNDGSRYTSGDELFISDASDLEEMPTSELPQVFAQSPEDSVDNVTHLPSDGHSNGSQHVIQAHVTTPPNAIQGNDEASRHIPIYLQQVDQYSCSPEQPTTNPAIKQTDDLHGSPWRNPNAQIRATEHTGIDPAYQMPMNVGPRHQNPTYTSHYRASASMVARNWNPLARPNAHVPHQQFPGNRRSLLNPSSVGHQSRGYYSTTSQSGTDHIRYRLPPSSSAPRISSTDTRFPQVTTVTQFAPDFNLPRNFPPPPITRTSTDPRLVQHIFKTSQLNVNATQSIFPNNNNNRRNNNNSAVYLLETGQHGNSSSTALYPNIQGVTAAGFPVIGTVPRFAGFHSLVPSNYPETTSTASNMQVKPTQRSKSVPGPAENKTKLPIKHSSTSTMDTRSTNNPASMGNSPVDHQGFKSEKDRVNEQLKSFLETTTLNNVPVIQSTNSAERSVRAMPERVTEAPRLTVNINIATDQHLPLTQAQTAPVTSPPHTLTVSPSYGRSTSITPLRRPRTPVVMPNRRSRDSQRSASTPKSQYDTQEELLNEFRGTAEEALSQHSESCHLRLFDDGGFGDTDEMEHHAEFYCNSDELDPAESLAAYLTDTASVDSSFKVTFVSRINGTVVPIKFSGKDKARSWQHIVEEELCRSAEINKMFGAERFLLRHEDGGIVDLESDLGDRPLTIYVEEATAVDIWWVERGMILH